MFTTVFHRDLRYNLFTADCISKNVIDGYEWEPHILKFMERFIQPTYNCIDIGANFGYHTLELAKLTQGQIFAFEPQVQNNILCALNIHSNLVNNVTLYDFAVGDTKQQIKIPIIPILSTKEYRNMGDIGINYDCDSFYSTTLEVPLDSMEDITQVKIDFLKIDVQGYELKCLKGMKNLLNRDKPVFIIEFEDHQSDKFSLKSKDVLDYIESLNYYVFFLQYEYPSDHVCVHKDNLAAFRERMKGFIQPSTDTTNRVCSSINGRIAEQIVM